MEPTEYIKLMPMVDSPAPVPVSKKIGMGNGYRDPSRFRYSTFSRPTVDPCQPVSFKTSTLIITYFKTFSGKYNIVFIVEGVSSAACYRMSCCLSRFLTRIEFSVSTLMSPNKLKIYLLMLEKKQVYQKHMFVHFNVFNMFSSGNYNHLVHSLHWKIRVSRYNK